jgi:hypothetical protein
MLGYGLPESRWDDYHRASVTFVEGIRFSAIVADLHLEGFNAFQRRHQTSGLGRTILIHHAHVKRCTVNAAEYCPKEEDKEDGKGNGPEKGSSLPGKLLDVRHQ